MSDPRTIDVLALLRCGINDPGSVLPRETYDANDGTGAYDEGVGSWGARAVHKLLADAGLLVQPDTLHTCPECGSTFDEPGDDPVSWTLPAEPGYEVTALRCDCHARIWHHDGTMWRSPGWPFEHFRWPGLLANHPKLTDATQEASHAR